MTEDVRRTAALLSLNDQLRKQLEESQAEAGELRVYGAHKHECLHVLGLGACDCGLTELLQRKPGAVFLDRLREAEQGYKSVVTKFDMVRAHLASLLQGYGYDPDEQGEDDQQAWHEHLVALGEELRACHKRTEERADKAEHVLRLSGDVREFEALIESSEKADANIRGVLEYAGSDYIACREEGGPEDIYGSLALTVGRIKSRREAAERERDEVTADAKRLRQRKHDIATERDKQEADIRSELAYWRRIRDEVSAALPKTGAGSSVNDFELAVKLTHERDEALAQAKNLLRSRVKVDEVMEAWNQALQEHFPGLSYMSFSDAFSVAQYCGEQVQVAISRVKELEAEIGSLKHVGETRKCGCGDTVAWNEKEGGFYCLGCDKLVPLSTENEPGTIGTGRTSDVRLEDFLNRTDKRYGPMLKRLADGDYATKADLRDLAKACKTWIEHDHPWGTVSFEGMDAIFLTLCKLTGEDSPGHQGEETSNETE